MSSGQAWKWTNRQRSKRSPRKDEGRARIWLERRVWVTAWRLAFGGVCDTKTNQSSKCERRTPPYSKRGLPLGCFISLTNRHATNLETTNIHTLTWLCPFTRPRHINKLRNVKSETHYFQACLHLHCFSSLAIRHATNIDIPNLQFTAWLRPFDRARHRSNTTEAGSRTTAS